MTHMMNRRTQTGLTLVELMIAMTLGIIMAGGVVTLFTFNRHSFNRDEMILRMQEDARQSLRELVNDLSMAGYWADLMLPASITPDGSLAVATDCGPAGIPNWIYRIVEPGTGNNESLVSVDNATAATANASFSCLGAEVVDGTDIISIKRLAGAQAPVVLANNTVYLRTNGTVGLLFRAPFPGAPTIPVAAPSADYEFRPSIYYIRRFANAPGDNIPTLCRKVLRGAGPSMVTECLATGIEDLQLEYGIDTSENGQPNVYTPSPTLAEMQNVVSARIFLLARTTEIDTRYTNDKQYSISNAADFTPNDSFHRRVFSTNVAIQNIRSINMMSF